MQDPRSQRPRQKTQTVIQPRGLIDAFILSFWVLYLSSVLSPCGEASRARLEYLLLPSWRPTSSGLSIRNVLRKAKYATFCLGSSFVTQRSLSVLTEGALRFNYDIYVCFFANARKRSSLRCDDFLTGTLRVTAHAFITTKREAAWLTAETSTSSQDGVAADILCRCSRYH